MQVIHDKSGSLPVTAGELVCFKQPFGNFQGKHLLGSSVSVIPGCTEKRTGKKYLLAAASETRSFRRSLSGQVALLYII